MSDAHLILQTAAVTALQAHPALAATLSGVFDGPPPRATYPYISVADGLTTDWSTKTQIGREIRLALTIWDDGEVPARLQQLAAHVDDAVAALPRDLPGWRIASCVFLRQLVSRDPVGPMAALVEYRVRLLAA
jgi:Protein of unknown function (DUF3168)